jgi:hypothetical protein
MSLNLTDNSGKDAGDHKRSTNLKNRADYNTGGFGMKTQKLGQSKTCSVCDKMMDKKNPASLQYKGMCEACEKKKKMHESNSSLIMNPLFLIKQAGLKEQLAAVLDRLGGWDELLKVLEGASLEQREATLSLEAYTPGIDPAPDDEYVSPEKQKALERFYGGYGELPKEEPPKEEPPKEEPPKEEPPKESLNVGFIAALLAGLLGISIAQITQNPKDAVERAKQKMEQPASPTVTSVMPNWRDYEKRDMINVDASNRFFYWATKMYSDKLRRGEPVEIKQIYDDLMKGYQSAAVSEWGENYKNYADPQVWAGIRAAAAKAAERYKEHHERRVSTSILPERGRKSPGGENK